VTSLNDTGLRASRGDASQAYEALAKIELVISDCDGTLLHTDKSLSTPAKDAVRALTDAGVRFTVASSRPGAGMRAIVQALDIDEPFAAYNGGMVLSPGDWKVLKTHVMRRDAVETALDSLARGNMDAWVFIGDQWYITNPNGQYVPLERRTVGYDGVVVKSFDDIDLDSVQKIVGSTPDAPALERLETEFRDTLEGRAHALRSQSYYIDITPPLANKGEAVRELAKLAGVALEHVAVLGDMSNDIAMFDVAGASIVMGQASADVQAHATLVSASNDDEGFAVGINGLLRARRGRLQGN
jgi:Cof subfamily protein (haloacid dehalogenase superfamily)